MTEYLHGVEVIETADGPRPIGAPGSTAIGLVGTAPGPAAGDLFLATSLRAARKRYAGGGTILPAIEAIHAQGAAPPIAVVQAYDSSSDVTAVAAEEQAWVAVEGEIKLDHESVSSVAIVKKVGNTAVAEADYEVDAARGVITVKSVATINANTAVLVSYSYGDVAVVTAAAMVVKAARLLDAQSELGVDPEILIAPGFTEAVTRDVKQAISAAPGATGLDALATRLRGIVVADGPGTTRADALAYRKAIDSKRVIVVDPKVKVLAADGTVSNAPASAYVAGLIARSDRDPERGWWASPSNQVLLGIAGTSRPVSFVLGDVDSEANALNADQVTTIVRQNGWRLWGGRTLSSDPKWSFVSVVRTADRINRALLAAHLWAVDRNIGATYVSSVIESVNAFLRDLRAEGAILGGTCWSDRDLNTDESIAAGRLYFDFDFTPAYPAERITFRSRITDDYVEAIF